MMFTSKVEIRNHIEDRLNDWYDQLVNEGSVSDDLFSEALANNGTLEIGYDFGTLNIDREGYVTEWHALNTDWYGDD